MRASIVDRVIYLAFMCNFPLLGPHCNVTFADHIGESYYEYHGLYIGYATCALLFSSVQTARAFYYTDTHRFHMQKIILLLATTMAMFLTIQSIDPQGYRNILPSIVEVLISNMTTYLGLVIMFILINSINGVFKHRFKLLDCDFWSIMIAVSFVTTFTMAFLQVYVDRSIFRGIKLILFAIIVGTATYKVDTLLLKTYNVLKERGEDLIRLKVHLIFFNVFISFVIVYQIVSGSITIAKKTQDKPELGADQIIFPMCEFIGIVLATSFMSRIKYKRRDTQNTHIITNPLPIKELKNVQPQPI